MFIKEIYDKVDRFEEFICNKYPDEAWRLIFYNEHRNSITLYITTQNYTTLMYVFSHRFLLLLLEFFELNEDYEECFEIKRQILEHNELMHDNLATFM